MDLKDYIKVYDNVLDDNVIKNVMDMQRDINYEYWDRPQGTGLMNGFKKHKIDHLSASSLNLWSPINVGRLARVVRQESHTLIQTLSD